MAIVAKGTNNRAIVRSEHGDILTSVYLTLICFSAIYTEMPVFCEKFPGYLIFHEMSVFIIFSIREQRT